MLRTKSLAIFFSLCDLSACSHSLAVDKPYQVYSPNGELQVEFALRDGVPTYVLKRHGQEIVSPSRLGVKLAGQPDLADNFQVITAHCAGHDETWTQPWGERKAVRNNYCELRVTLRQQDQLAREIVVVFQGVQRRHWLSVRVARAEESQAPCH